MPWGRLRLTAVTCVVSEAPGTVRGIQEVDPALVADQVRINLEHFPCAREDGDVVIPRLSSVRLHGVLDGADIPRRGGPGHDRHGGRPPDAEEAVAVYEELLLPGAALLTPQSG